MPFPGRLPTLPWFFDALRAHPLAAAIGCPLDFGRDTFTSPQAFMSSRIVIDVRVGANLEAYAPLDQNSNRQILGDGKRYHYIRKRAVAGEAIVYGVDTRLGARRKDHVEKCDQLLNALLFACRQMASEKATRCDFTEAGGGILAPEGESEAALPIGFQEVGIRYQLFFFLAAPVVGDPRDVGAFEGVQTDIDVPFNGQTFTAGPVLAAGEG